MKLEVCIDSLQSAANAIFNGADELEVCIDLSVGGITPSMQFVKQVIDMIDLYVNSYPVHLTIEKPKVNVMIRCREGWDFCYNENEIAFMLEDIKDFKELPVDRFVFGALTATGEVDVENCKKIIEQAAPKPVTFHRAFDKVQEPFDALDKITALGFDRILTSGMQESVDNEKAVEMLKVFLEMFGARIDIMPGAGVNIGNAEGFKNLGFKYLHGSFSKQITTSQGEMLIITDGETVKKVKQIIKPENLDITMTTCESI